MPRPHDPSDAPTGSPPASPSSAPLPEQLRGARLDGASLADAELSGRDLSGASLEGADLRGAKLSQATLSGARLQRADLREADLRGADLGGADLSEADLRGALLRGARLDDARASGARISGIDAEPAVLDALRRAGGRQSGLASLSGSLARLVPRRWTNPLERRARAAGRARAALLGGPGADLQDANLESQNLSGAAWAGVRLDRANLVAARLIGADLHEASLVEIVADEIDLRRARLSGARLVRARLVDADLRGADLGGADLTGADLGGADLREANLRGALLDEAILGDTRLSDLDLSGVSLRRAILTGADVSGVSWEGAEVSEARLTGALGLGEDERRLLASRGAHFEEDAAFSGMSARWVRSLLGLAALGLGVYLAARFLAPGAESPEHVAEEAEALADSDPLEASRRYEALAKAAERPEDQVGHRIEAAGLAEKAGDSASARRLLEDALEAAGDDPALLGRVRLRLGELLASQERWAELEAAVEPLLALEGQPEQERARGIVLYEDACTAQGKPATKVEEALTALALLPEAQGALLQAVAEIRANRGQDEAALAVLERLEGIALPDEPAERALATRARVLDRLGRAEASRLAWAALLDRAAPETLSHQSALLALADLDRRDGKPDAALARLGPLLREDADVRLHGRAQLLRGGIAEDAGRADEAIGYYRAALSLGGLDADTVTEVRLALARLLLAEGGEESARDVLGDMEPAAVTAVLAEAQLGEGRRLLDQGETKRALAVFDRILGAAGSDAGAAVLDKGVLRAARSGRAEALAQSGEVQEAIGVWQELLDGELPASERPATVLLLATALLGRGDAERAAGMFTELARSPDADTAAQGRLGLAEAARAAGETERARALLRRVADEAPDVAWRVRALGALAEIAQEERRTEAALEAWRAILGLLPPGHGGALDARLAIIGALEEGGRTAEALTACATARGATAGADRGAVRLVCGELAARLGQPEQAMRDLSAVIEDLGSTEVQVSEAALALARLLPQEAARDALRGALDRCDTPAARVPVLAALSPLLEASGDETGARATNEELDQLAAKAPEVAAAYYEDAASRARAAGNSAQARPLLERALALELPAAARAELLVELGQTLLDLGEASAAQQRFTEGRKAAVADSPTAILAEIGLAEVERRAGAPRDAASRLQRLAPTDESTRERWLEALARALGDARDPGAAETWASLAEGRPEGDETRVFALRGQADAALAAGKAADALGLYEDATRAATEASQQGWASLGSAEALRALNRQEEADAVLRALSEHPDPEVALSAVIRASNLASEGRDFSRALALVEGRDGATLGAAWDATLTEARVRALSGLNRREEAQAALDALGRRWPGQEEAELPRLLGLAHLAHQEGDLEAAKTLAAKARDTAKDPGYRTMAETLLATLAR